MNFDPIVIKSYITVFTAIRQSNKPTVLQVTEHKQHLFAFWEAVALNKEPVHYFMWDLLFFCSLVKNFEDYGIGRKHRGQFMLLWDEAADCLQIEQFGATILTMLILHSGIHFFKKANVWIDIGYFLCNIRDGILLDEGPDFWVLEVDYFLHLMVRVGLEYYRLELQSWL